LRREPVRGRHAEAPIRLETISGDGVHRIVADLTLIDYPMARGAIAGYYRNANMFLSLEHCDKVSGTPAAKSHPVRVLVA